jgi:inhibitor of KinA
MGGSGPAIKQRRALSLILCGLPRHLCGMRVLPLGDASLLIELGHSIDPATHERVRCAFDALSTAAIPGVIDIVPAYTGVAVHYDPVAFARDAGTRELTPYDRIRRAVVAVLDAADADPATPGPVVDIPVRYGGEYGPDLDYVARHAGMPAAEVVALHASVEYTVYMIGFTPGFPYLGGLPARLATPRRASPRQAVPAGSVGIAGSHTGVYPLRTPGGWQIIGRTDERLFRPELDPPTLLRIGDRVRFVDVGAA